MRLHFEDGERDLIRARLQLADDADDTAIAQAVATWIQEEPPADNDNDNDTGNDNVDDIDASQVSDDDAVVVDVASFVRMQQRDRIAAQVEEQSRVRDRNELVEEAIADGKFGSARRNHYRDRFDSDPDGTRALIARLMPNTVPREAVGEDQPDEADQTTYPTEWVPEVAARASREQGRGHNRVRGEE